MENLNYIIICACLGLLLFYWYRMDITDSKLNRKIHRMKYDKKFKNKKK